MVVQSSTDIRHVVRFRVLVNVPGQALGLEVETHDGAVFVLNFQGSGGATLLKQMKQVAKDVPQMLGWKDAAPPPH
jgi:hypothetical protein